MKHSLVWIGRAVGRDGDHRSRGDGNVAFRETVVLTANATLGDEDPCPNWAGPSSGLTPLPLSREQPSRKSCAGQFLDLLMHQQPAGVALHQELATNTRMRAGCGRCAMP